jgi:signal transduction histidine kinase
MIAASEFSHIPSLQGVPEGELAWFAEHCSLRELGEGETLFEQGESAQELIVMLRGGIEVVRREGGKEVSAFTVAQGEITGLLPFSRMTRYGGAGRAVAPTRVARFDGGLLPELHRHAPTILQRLVNVMLDRAREFTRLSEQQERLVSLGTMAAGLAHELNNPASAARRAARTLEETLQAFNAHAFRMLSEFTFKEAPPGDAFGPLYDAITLEPPTADALERSDLEDDLAEWLEDRGVPRPFDVATTLVSAGLGREVVASFSERLRPEQVENFLLWLPKDIEMRLLARDLTQSTARISELVQAMKAYSHMDQGRDKSEADLHKGLDDTLAILGHKLKPKGVEVVKDYGELPFVPAYGAELNQVWTNLIDNAIDAVAEGGAITLRTRLDRGGETVCVDVIDDGPGIAEEILPRIFEPFFTTKGVGEGSGLGLDIARRIVSRRHGGSIRVVSEPGHTRFTVCLPLKEEP